MPYLEHHALFVDCGNVHNIRDKISKELLPQISKFLEEWRGDAPDVSTFRSVSNPALRLSPRRHGNIW